MGMCLTLFQLTPEQVADVRADPERLTGMLECEDETLEVECRLSIGRAWDGLDVLLTVLPGDSLLGFLQDAEIGEPIAGTDAGYGEARVLAPSLTSRLLAALEHVPVWELRRRYLEENMDRLRLYVPPSSRDPRSEELAWLAEQYERLVEFLRRTVKAGAFLLLTYT